MLTIVEQQRNRVQSSHAANPARPDRRDSRLASMGDPLDAQQQSLGNQTVQRMLNSRVIQAKLTINEPGDEYEQEADRVAEQVMRMPDPGATNEAAISRQGHRVQRMCTECKEEAIQAKGASGNAPPQAVPDAQSPISVMGSGSKPLPESVRSFFEPRFGYDFGQVRVHTDARAAESARAVNALAYTVGRDVVFGAGQYAPETAKGKNLLAHELTHVVHQRGAREVNDSSNFVVHLRHGGPVIQRRVDLDVQDWDATKLGPPTLQNGTDPRYIEVPPTGQISVSALVQVNGDAADPCTDYEIGTTQTAWIAWTIANYRGRNPGDGGIRVWHRPPMPMRDPGATGDVWFDPASPRNVLKPGFCGDSVGIFHVDSPWHAIPKMRYNGAVAGSPLNYLRSYTRGLHLVTYLTARDPGGSFLRSPLRFVYWNSLQDFTFTPNYANPLLMWPYAGQIRVNVGAKGVGETADAPYYTTSGPKFNDHFNNSANWGIDEKP
jgi:hypothetical protein